MMTDKPIQEKPAELGAVQNTLHNVYHSFVKHPPKVEPSVMEFEVPCKGTPFESVKFFIRNYSIDRIVFKCKGTKLDRFRLSPATGFIEAKAVQTIDVIPTKPMQDEKGFSKKDHFSAVVAPAPKTEPSLSAREIWKMNKAPELTLMKRFQVNIKVVDKRKPIDLEDDDGSTGSMTEAR